jgi:hypothetical protein
MPDAGFGYTAPHGASVLRQALSDYLARVRASSPIRPRMVERLGAGAHPAACAEGGRRERIAIEDPCLVEVCDAVERVGWSACPWRSTTTASESRA